MPTESDWSPAAYRELRRLAEGFLAGERGGHTLQPTALVHEVWLRLQRSGGAAGLDRSALPGLAARSMRRILIEHARRRGARKRGGESLRQELDAEPPAPDPADFAIDLESALEALEREDPDLARVVELRFHAGLSVEETAEALGTSARTVKRRWRFARAWLQRRMEDSR